MELRLDVALPDIVVPVGYRVATLRSLRGFALVQNLRLKRRSLLFPKKYYVFFGEPHFGGRATLPRAVDWERTPSPTLPL